MPLKLKPKPPSHTSIRTSPLEVLHLSMPRTGSVSMMAAYQILGLRTYHGFDFVERTSDQVQWERAIDAKFYGKGKPLAREDFDAFLGDFHVLSDMPVIGFSEEFVDMYPERAGTPRLKLKRRGPHRAQSIDTKRTAQAKVILVNRDIEKWYHSFSTYVLSAGYTWTVLFIRYMLDPFLAARPATLMVKLEYAMFNASNRAGLYRNAKDTYRRHYAMIRRIVPQERLLEYKLGSGWEPLCKFLGKEVPGPEVEFPCLNESKEFAKLMKRVQYDVMMKGLRCIVGSPFILVPLVVGVAAWVFAKRDLMDRAQLRF
ncbi:hypothetical protein PABG_07854 [Paracoccidioides brasiliensis Pb03]|nr:hypothetical protein PABG_07854 [Paracoccidioides brasiliensis Pb03]